MRLSITALQKRLTKSRETREKDRKCHLATTAKLRKEILRQKVTITDLKEIIGFLTMLNLSPKQDPRLLKTLNRRFSKAGITPKSRAISTSN
jgi:hypothetical protein